jgi:equilibrative nucleoside transporter 1/2/3
VSTKLIFPSDQVVASSLAYFFIGAFTLLLCIAAYYILLSLDISKQCLHYGVVESNIELAEQKNSQSNNNNNNNNNSYGESSNISQYKPAGQYQSIARTLPSTPSNQSVEEGSVLLPQVGTGHSNNSVDKWELLQKIGFNEMLVFLVFFSTLSLWPPLVTEIKSFNFPLLQSTQWWPLLLLLNFAISDCIGRLLTPFRYLKHLQFYLCDLL